jgi:hypothetical protein
MSTEHACTRCVFHAWTHRGSCLWPWNFAYDITRAIWHYYRCAVPSEKAGAP